MTDQPRPTGANDTQDGLPAPGERPTLKTLARLTGLAVATVSRALNDAPDISQSTKRKVHEAADRIGYRPNRAGVRLRTGKTNVISLVLSTEHDLMNHTARLLSSVAGALRGTSYHLIVTPYFPDQDPMVPVRYIVETRSADGVILNQTEPLDPRVEYLMEHSFPFATHGRTDRSADHAYFDFDNESFARCGVEAVAARGRRSVLLVAPHLRQSYARHMVSGLREASARLGLVSHVLKNATSDSPSVEIDAAITAHLALHPDTDAIISGSTAASMAAAVALEAAGRRVGDDADVFAKEGMPFLHHFRPGILTVPEDVAHAGDFLARAVLKQIADPKSAPMQGLDVPKWEAAAVRLTGY